MVENDQDRFEAEVMNELQQQEKSMKTIATAFVKAQKEFAPALKTSTNPHFRSKYVSLDGCIEAVLDALNNNGIALIQQTHDCESGVKIETILIHESGETLTGGILHVPAPKQDPQGYGSALTYARRYSLMATCGIAPEDDDGNLATERAGSVVKKPQTNALSFFIPNKEAISCPDLLTWEKNFDAMSEQLVNSSLPTEDKIAKLKALIDVNLPTLDRLPVDKKVLYIGRQATRINKTKG
ncbi:Essential recombination function protein [uncultured Caudovirales phage]|uniref:Essential recombination function protein n=1 Tax=uncultured Caudovirales phage TaxID=2100421 RepID=A0A6J5P0M3_9CAUD|nr:Essential recombination function protein [uncultured Caudovirales phage]